MTMSDVSRAYNSVAIRYASAFLELAESEGVSDSSAKVLRRLGDILRGSSDLRLALSNPCYSRAEISSVMEDILSRLKADDLSRKLVLLLVSKGRQGLLLEVIGAYLSALSGRRGEVVAEVRTAVALSKSEQDELVSALRDVAGKSVSVDLATDSDLIGGFYVKIGSMMIDTSVKTSLARLSSHMKGI